jgi:hypothetical protein
METRSSILLRNYGASAYVYAWNVADPAVHIEGKSASIAYAGPGSVKDPSGAKTEQGNGGVSISGIERWAKANPVLPQTRVPK